MFVRKAFQKCQVIKRVTDQGIYRCFKPATVILVLNMPDADPVFVCLDCARELAKEILDSVPGGKRDVATILARRVRRPAR